jgi:hypothetical protein
MSFWSDFWRGLEKWVLSLGPRARWRRRRTSACCQVSVHHARRSGAWRSRGCRPGRGAGGRKRRSGRDEVFRNWQPPLRCTRCMGCRWTSSCSISAFPSPPARLLACCRWRRRAPASAGSCSGARNAQPRMPAARVFLPPRSAIARNKCAAC